MKGRKRLTIELMRCALVFFVATGLLAQTPQTADPGGLGRVEGRVVNGTTGEPLRKTQVSLQGGPIEYSATSDGNGQFAIEKVAPGSYSLSAQHQNFAMLFYGATRPGMPGSRITVGAGQSVAGLELKLTPFGVISGKVVDQDGDPVVGVSIMILKWGYTRGVRSLLPAGGGGTTNDRGEYRIHSLAAGRYYLLARPVQSEPFQIANTDGTRIAATRTPSRETYGLTFYPSASDAPSASAIQLAAGQEVPGVDIQLRRTRTYTLQGKIAGFSSNTRTSLILQTKDSPGMGFGSMGPRTSVPRQGDGSFVLRGVAPGLYELIVMTDNHVSARQEVSVGNGDLEGLVVTLVEPSSIKGRIRVDGAANPPSVKGVRVSLNPLDLLPMNLPNASAAEDGSFAMDQVSPDHYRVATTPIDGAYLRTVRWNGQVSNDGSVELTGGSSSTLELLFAATTAQVEGDVKTADDQPASGVRVLLVPGSGRESDFRMTVADQNGHFRTRSMPPGPYSAVAVDSDVFGMPDSALMKVLQKEATALTVEENGHATIALKVVPQAVLDAVP